MKFAVTTFVLVIVTTVGVPAVVHAQRVDPHTAVTSDGSSVAIDELPAVTGVEGFEGSAPSAPVAPSVTRPPSAQTIIEPDERGRVFPTTAYPARAVALVTFKQAGLSLFCTAWMIGEDTAATAGHCVHSGGPSGVFSTDVRVFPGRNAGSGPFGSCTARKLYTVVGWSSLRDERFDYGAIKLNCRIGLRTGWFGFFAQPGSLTGTAERLNGYPEDKRFTQWRSDDQIRLTLAQQVFYEGDTLGGMSGSPVYQPARVGRFCTGVCAVAIHTRGFHGAPPHGTHNHATRITPQVFKNLVAWRNAP